jgi:uncharacterized protein involved in tolerance to divalent cations
MFIKFVEIYYPLKYQQHTTIMEKLHNYEAPQIEVFEVEVERGFAQSTLEDIKRNDPVGW